MTKIEAIERLPDFKGTDIRTPRFNGEQTMRSLATTILLATLTASAQKPAPPIVPIQISYRYWPEQFVQFVTGTETPYSMLEFDVDQKTYDLILTDRATKKRVHYASDETIAAQDRVSGDEAYVTKVLFERPENAGKDATYNLRAVLHDNSPLEWRFIQGSEMMEQGGGLSKLAEIPIPVLAYREQGAVSGEGTALVVGKAVSPAEMWTEISKPPYFVAWRGAYSLGATTVMLSAGKQTWKIDSAPDAIATGAVWKLSNEAGRTRTLTIKKLEGTNATVLDQDSAVATYSRIVTATTTPTGWQINSIHYIPHDEEKHAFTLTFTPALGSGSSTVDFVLGKKNKIGTATIEATAASSELSMKSPDWIKGKAITTQVIATDGAITLVSMPKR
jgi:hypothetical protein